MPYLAIPDSVAGTIYTDYEGNASGVTPGSRTLAVDGRYFDVNYFSGSPYSQSVNVEPRSVVQHRLESLRTRPAKRP